MAPPFRAAATVALIAVLMLAAPGCSRYDSRLYKHQESLESLGATTAAIGEAWLGGSVSGTYARTALEQTYLLVEQERAALAKNTKSLLDPRGAELSQKAERLSRILAQLVDDVGAADAASVRRRLAEVPLAPHPRS